MAKEKYRKYLLAARARGESDGKYAGIEKTARCSGKETLEEAEARAREILKARQKWGHTTEYKC